jgi:glutamine amidotransferase
MIGIIDYGMGNLRSVQKAFEHVNAACSIITKATELQNCQGVILPGVGAFRDAIQELQQQNFVSAIRDYVQTGKPLLGICLGQQLLFERSFEDGEYEGLGLIAGDVVRFRSEPGLKIPHMGWNSLQQQRPHPLLQDIKPDAFVYFVHSYFVKPENSAVTVASTQHGGQTFSAIVAQGSVAATQFHPEKSQQVGLQILKNFSRMVADSVSSSNLL